MDTKLKNGNQNVNGAKWFGILLVGIAAALFVMLLPKFDKKACAYYETAGRDSIESEEFVTALMRSSYVFYKNVIDKRDDCTYEELYLDKYIESDELDGSVPAKEQAERKAYLLERATLSNAEFVDVSRFQDVLGLYVSQIARAAAQLQDSYIEDIRGNMDYYVLDKTTGTEIKNTERQIEKLYGDAEEIAGAETIAGMEAIADAYDYYIILDYDEMGKLQNIYVKGQDADKLLKTVQIVENSGDGFLVTQRDVQETYAFYYDEMENIEKILMFTQKKPANAVFIYAMTKEQMQIFQNRGYAGAYIGRNFGSVSQYYSYAQAGVQNVYQVFLLVIFVLTMLLAFCKPRILAGRTERKAPMEAVILMVIFSLVPIGSELLLEFVTSIGNNDLLEWLNDSFPIAMSLGTEYEIIKNAVCFCYFAAWFGVWYFCCLEFSDIVYGLKHYIQTRCLLYRICSRIFGVCKKAFLKFKEEALDIDLGKDMNRLLMQLLFINFCLLATACLFWVFGILGLLVYIVGLYYFLKKYIYKIRMQYELLLEATNSIAEGNFENDFDEDFGIFESYKEELYKVQDGFKKAVEEEVKSQRMKTDLITNVSHDLKTPLTAIITYIDLLKEENITPEQRKEYLETLERKSLRLKILIEDLFEVSKTSSGNINLEPVPVDICHLMRQVYLEYEDKMKQAGLHVRFSMPEEKIILELDSQKTYRIFENLYVNIIKYALPDTRVFIVAWKREDERGYKDGIHIELKNISAQEIVGNPQDLSERFVRGDASRNTEGSGLGLAIAKNLTELQGGIFMIDADGDLFKVVIEWQR